MIATVAFDADDTLWQNERFFRMTQEKFAALLADYSPADHLAERLLAAERKNVGRYGFGIKGFALSMIETALDVSEDRVPASVIRALVREAQEMLAHPIELLPGARRAVEALSGRYRLMVITKGDLLDQERKVAQSGLGDLFEAVEIVSSKDARTYSSIFRRHGVEPRSAVMVGNSLRSDVIPPIAAGAWGVHVPHDLTWALEHDTAPEDHPRFRRIPHLGDLPALVEGLDPDI